MPSLFDEIESASQAAITSVFGGGIRVLPMAGDKNYGGGPDPARAAVEIVATFASAPTIGAIDYSGTQKNGADSALAHAEIWIDRAALAAMPYRPRRGDKIEILNGVTPPPVFVVAAAEPGDHGDMRIVLAR